jgi:hypothetical protein
VRKEHGQTAKKKKKEKKERKTAKKLIKPQPVTLMAIFVAD